MGSATGLQFTFATGADTLSIDQAVPHDSVWGLEGTSTRASRRQNPKTTIVPRAPAMDVPSVADPMAAIV